LSVLKGFRIRHDETVLPETLLNFNKLIQEIQEREFGGFLVLCEKDLSVMESEADLMLRQTTT